MDPLVPARLSEIEKARLRAEELYRDEIRKELGHTHSNRGTGRRIWSFVNTSFGIWLLSSVVLGGLGFLYATTQSVLAERRAEATSVRKLDLEIESRLRQWSRLGEVEEIRRDFAAPGNFARFYGWLTKAPNISSQFLYVVYPVFKEFEQRPLLSLVTELHSHVHGIEGKELDRVIDQLITWNPIIDQQPTFEAYRAKTFQLLWLPRWKPKPALDRAT